MIVRLKDIADAFLLHDREIRTNLARLRQTGAQVHYFQADVRDEKAFTAVIEAVYQQYGKIDGVIFAALVSPYA